MIRHQKHETEGAFLLESGFQEVVIALSILPGIGEHYPGKGVTCAHINGFSSLQIWHSPNLSTRRPHNGPRLSGGVNRPLRCVGQRVPDEADS